jgi:hypothetical protein
MCERLEDIALKTSNVILIFLKLVIYLTTGCQHKHSRCRLLLNITSKTIFHKLCFFYPYFILYASFFALEASFSRTTTTTITSFHNKSFVCNFFDKEPLHTFVKSHNAETHDSAHSNNTHVSYFLRHESSHRSDFPLITFGRSINLKMPRLWLDVYR